MCIPLTPKETVTAVHNFYSYFRMEYIKDWLCECWHCSDANKDKINFSASKNFYRVWYSSKYFTFVHQG